MDNLAISVRRATSADAPALAALVNDAYVVEQFFVDGERTSVAEIADLLRAGVFFVLEAEGGLAAAIHVERRADTAYVRMLSVRPALQGLGLGERMVRIAEAMGEAMGATAMALQVVNLREDLGRWYRSLGYREVGTSPFEDTRLKRPCHFIDMHKDLRTSAVLGALGAA